MSKLTEEPLSDAGPQIKGNREMTLAQLSDQIAAGCRSIARDITYNTSRVVTGVGPFLRKLEPWFVVITLFGVAGSLVITMIDLEDRQSERVFRAWQIVRGYASSVSETAQAGTSGSSPRAALELLNRKFDGFVCSSWLVTRISALTTGNRSRRCFFPIKIRESLAGLSLPDAYLAEIDLPNAELTDANLANTDLMAANLMGATLRRARLNDAYVGDADLSCGGSELRDAEDRRRFSFILSGLGVPDRICAQLGDASLKGTSFWHADLSGAVLRGADLTGADLRETTLTGTVFNGANLSDADLLDAEITQEQLDSACGDSAPLNLAPGLRWTPRSCG